MCKGIIEETAKYIYRKDKTFRVAEFVNAVNGIVEFF